MFFSKNDFQKIELYFQDRAKKDTDFPLTQSVTNEDTMAIVQDGMNKRISLNVLFELFRTYMEANYVEDPNWDDHLAAILNYMNVGGPKDIVESFGTVTYTGTTASIPYLSSRINTSGSRSNSITLNAANANSAGLMTKDMFSYVDKVRSELALEALLRTGLVRDLSVEGSSGKLYIRHTNSAFGTPVGTYEDTLIPTVTNACDGLVPHNQYVSNAWLADNFLDTAYIVTNKNNIQQLIAHKDDYASKTDRTLTFGSVILLLIQIVNNEVIINLPNGVYTVTDNNNIVGTLIIAGKYNEEWNIDIGCIFITNLRFDTQQLRFIYRSNSSSIPASQQNNDHIYIAFTDDNSRYHYEPWVPYSQYFARKKIMLVHNNIVNRFMENAGTYNVEDQDSNSEIGLFILIGKPSDYPNIHGLFITNLYYDTSDKSFVYPSEITSGRDYSYNNIYIAVADATDHLTINHFESFKPMLGYAYSKSMYFHLDLHIGSSVEDDYVMINTGIYTRKIYDKLVNDDITLKSFLEDGTSVTFEIDHTTMKGTMTYNDTGKIFEVEYQLQQSLSLTNVNQIKVVPDTNERFHFDIGTKTELITTLQSRSITPSNLLKCSVLNAIDDDREGPHMSFLKGVSIKLPINITETTARGIFSSGESISIAYREGIKTSTTGVFVLTDANNANYTYDFKNCTVENHDGIYYLYKQGQYN